VVERGEMSSGFIFEVRKSLAQALKVETVMRQGMGGEKGAQSVYEQLQRQGLGYKKQDVLTDYRRFQAVDKALTPESRERAEKWYDKVYEPFRKAQGYTAKQASEALTKIRSGSADVVEEALKAREYIEKYTEVFA
jgi:hypothetical protein